VTTALSVSEQIAIADVAEITTVGLKSIIWPRPDGEGADQPTFAGIEWAAKAAHGDAVYQPIVLGKVGDDDAVAFGNLMDRSPKLVLAYCPTGTRSAMICFLSEGDYGGLRFDIPTSIKLADYDMSVFVRRVANGGKTPADVVPAVYDGYGSYRLSVERVRILIAEFSYGEN
jgi:sulfide:quinone oxidoreductase